MRHDGGQCPSEEAEPPKRRRLATASVYTVTKVYLNGVRIRQTKMCQSYLEAIEEDADICERARVLTLELSLKHRARVTLSILFHSLAGAVG